MSSSNSESVVPESSTSSAASHKNENDALLQLQSTLLGFQHQFAEIKTELMSLRNQQIPPKITPTELSNGCTSASSLTTEELMSELNRRLLGVQQEKHQLQSQLDQALGVIKSMGAESELVASRAKDFMKSSATPSTSSYTGSAPTPTNAIASSSTSRTSSTMHTQLIQQPFNVDVRLLSGEELHLTGIYPSDSIRNIKVKIQEKDRKAFPVSCQCLFIGKLPLKNDSRTLESYLPLPSTQESHVLLNLIIAKPSEEIQVSCAMFRKKRQNQQDWINRGVHWMSGSRGAIVFNAQTSDVLESVQQMMNDEVLEHSFGSGISWDHTMLFVGRDSCHQLTQILPPVSRIGDEESHELPLEMDLSDIWMICGQEMEVSTPVESDGTGMSLNFWVVPCIDETDGSKVNPIHQAHVFVNAIACDVFVMMVDLSVETVRSFRKKVEDIFGQLGGSSFGGVTFQSQSIPENAPSNKLLSELGITNGSVIEIEKGFDSEEEEEEDLY